MELDKWVNTKSGVTAAGNGPLGSIRGWINRAYDMKFQKDYASLKNSCTIDFREATVGAIFRRPCKLPDFGDQRVMYRFFYIPKGYNGAGGGRLKDYDEPQAVIGVVLAVDPKDFLKYDRALRAAGAEWVYFTMPQEIPKLVSVDNGRRYFQYNHEEIYGMLERGMRVTEIVERLGPGAQQAAVSYIKARWLKGHPPNGRPAKKMLDRVSIMEDHNAGLSAMQIADKHNTTKQSVYSVLKKYGAQLRAYG